MSSAKEAARRETGKLILSVAGSVLFAVAVCVLLAMNGSALVGVPSWAFLLSIPFLGYGYSLAVSAISQYSSCGSVNMTLIALQNLAVFGANALVAGVLVLETLPIKKYLLGEFPPTNPLTGFPLDPASPEFAKAQESESHYKLQFFSGVVKAVLPVWMNEPLKEGLVACYWVFWMTLLPLYTLLGVQTTCS